MLDQNGAEIDGRGSGSQNRQNGLDVLSSVPDGSQKPGIEATHPGQMLGVGPVTLLVFFQISCSFRGLARST